MTFRNHQTALGLCLLTGTPFLLWGKPGTGKTATLSGFAKQWNMHLEVVLLSVRDVGDMSGIPYVVNGDMHLSPPDFARRIVEAEKQGKQSILFLDEYSTAPHSMQAASLRLVAERYAGDIKLPASCRIGGAANPPDMASGGQSITPPACNRFCHLPYEMDTQTLVTGMTSQFPPVPVVELPPNIPEMKYKTKHLVASFLQARGKDYISASETDIVGVGSSATFDPADLAFPSPRMWTDYVVPLLAGCLFGRVDGKPVNHEVTRLLMNGCVGKTVANELIAFITNLDLPDAHSVLAGKAHYSAKKVRSDVAGAIASSFVLALDGSQESWLRCGEVLADIAEKNGADVIFAQAMDYLNHRPENTMPSARFTQIFHSITGGTHS